MRILDQRDRAYSATNNGPEVDDARYPRSNHRIQEEEDVTWIQRGGALATEIYARLIVGTA